MLRVEQQRTVAYFNHLSSLAATAATDMQVQHMELAENLPEVSANVDVTLAAGSWKENVQQMAQLSAQQLLHEEWSATFKSWAQQAHAAFQHM